jgi:predicted PurR-regulated permease PerM
VSIAKPPSNSADRRLWEFRWVRDLAVLLSCASLVYLAYEIRAILLPVIVGLALAYVINPVVRGAEMKWRWPRWLTTGLIQFCVIAFFGGLLIFVLPKLVVEFKTLLSRLPGYYESLSAQIGLSPRELADRVREILTGPSMAATTQPAATTMPDAVATTMPSDVAHVVATTQPAVSTGLTQVDLQTIGTIVAKSVNVGATVLLTAFGWGAYLVLAGVVSMLCMFFFSWRLDGITRWFHSFIPLHKKSLTLHVLQRMDVSISSFIRGRIIQGTILAFVLAVGWSIAGVPYALLLALLCGVLNLVPYASLIGLPTAILLTWIDHVSAGMNPTLTAILIWPIVAYAVGQQLDAWIVEPLVQGRATGLDPLAILLAVLIGSALAGVFGMLLAVPIAACVKILNEEILLPKFRAFLGSRTDGEPPGDSPPLPPKQDDSPPASA